MKIYILFLIAFFIKFSVTAQTIIQNPATSCNYATGRGGTAISGIAIHDMEGSYAGSISWFQTCPCPSGTCPSNCSGSYRGCNGSTPLGASSAHYCIRSSDGQITQMVADANRAYHVGSENAYTIGIEHEGYCSQTGWYTNTLYSSSACLVKNLCATYGINPTTTYSGAGCSCSQSSTACLQSTKNIKGHQMFPNQTHTDPGPNWNWANYYNLVNGSPCGITTTVLCNNDDPCSSQTLIINTSGTCNSTSCSTIDATAPSTSIPYSGSSTCASNYQSGRYDDDVWFKITPNSTSPITIRVAPTSNTANFDVSVGIYQGNCSNLSQIGCADSYGVGTTENVTFTPSSGTTYYIRVFSYGIGTSYAGNFSICAFSNSTCTDQFESNNSASTATLVFANPLNTGSSNYPLQANMGFAGDQDWYRVNIQACGTLTVNLSNLPYNYDLELWNSSASSALDGSYSSGTTGEQVTFTSTSSTLTNVYIKVYSNSSSNFTTASCYGLQFIWTPGSCPCTPPTTPTTPTSNSPQCGNVTLTRGTPPSGITWYWQGTSCGTNMSNSSTTYTATSSNTYYLRAYNPDNGGCWSSSCANASVTVNSSPNVSINPSSQSGCAGQNISFSASGASTYTWNSQCPSGNCNYSSAGTYTVTATGTANGCTATASATLTVNGAPTNASASASPNPVCTGSTLYLTANANNAINYSWSGPSGFSSSQQNPPVNSIQTSQAGLYTVSASNNCGTATASVNVNVTQVPTTPSPTASANPVCEGSTINLSVTGGNSWQWSGPNNFASAQQNPQINSGIYGSGNYCVVVSQNGCQSQQGCINIMVNPKPTFTIQASNNNNNVYCTGQQLNLSGSNCALNYQWSNNTNGTTNCSTTATPAGNQTYSATVTDGNNCSASASTSISTTPSVTPSIISISQNPANPVCAGSNINFTANALNGGNNPVYTWSSTDGQSGNGAQFTLYNTQSNVTVSCTLTSDAVCALTQTATANKTVTIQQPQQVSVTISTPATAVCTGENVTFTAQPPGGGTYQWFLNGAASQQSNINTFTVPNVQNDIDVYCILTSQQNCVTGSPAQSANINVSVQNQVQAFANISVSPSATICENTPVTFTAVAGNGGNNPTYQWMINGQPAPGNNAGVTYTSTTLQNNNVVTCVITSNSGCVISPGIATSNPITMVVNALPVATVAGDTTVCAGSAVALWGTGGIACHWNIAPGLTLADTSNCNPVITANTTTTYTFIARDNNNCQATSTVTVSTIPFPMLNITPTNASVCGGNPVSLSVLPAGTTYLWNGPSSFTGNTQTVSATQTGQYTVTVTDPGICQGSATVTVNVVSGTPPVVNAGNNQSVYSGASVTLGGNPTAQGNAPFSYSWSPATSNNTIANPQATPTGTTTYIVTVTDANNCSASGSVVITVSPCDTSIHPVITNNQCMLSVPQYNELVPPYNSAKYQWITIDGAAPNDTMRFYTVMSTGYYTCRVKLGDCPYIYSNDLFVTYPCVISVEDIEGLNFSVVPNPSNGRFTISFENPNATQIQLKIFDAIGQLIIDEKLTKTTARYTKDIDVGTNAKGLYVLQLSTNGKTVTQKIEVY